MKICVVVPAYNEELVIGDVVDDIKETFRGTKYFCEVVVVNDQSTDKTAENAQKATIINHLINQGAGGATSTGLRYAETHKANWVITLDGDGQHKAIDALSCLEQAIKIDADLLIGSRLINKKGMSKVKILGNRGLTLITYLLFGINVTDSQSGLRIFSQKAIDILEWKSTGYDFCSEMLWRAKKANLNIAEHPIQAIYTDYSKSKGQSNWNAVNIVKSLVRRRIVEMFE
jgi:glycosyltransferase involved in cell wall biosynthesis